MSLAKFDVYRTVKESRDFTKVSNGLSIVVERSTGGKLKFCMKEYPQPDLAAITLTEVMHALSDPWRVGIVRSLLEAHGREFACNELPMDLSKATRSHHIQVLREAGLLHTRVEGTKCMTSLREEELNARFPGLLDLVLATEPAGSDAGKSYAR